MKIIILIALLIFGFNILEAQERTAGGTLQDQASWSTLHNLADQANSNAKNAHSRLSQTEKCAAKGMLYAPLHSKVDADGCIEAHKPNDSGVNFTVIWDRLNGLSNGLNSLSANVNSINSCAASGGVFNKSTNSCSSSGARWYLVSEGGHGYRDLDKWSQSQGYPARCSGSQGVIGRLCRSASERCYKFEYSQWENETNDSRYSGTTAWSKLYACE